MRPANQPSSIPDAIPVEVAPSALERQITTIYRTLITMSSNAAAKYGVKTNEVLAEVLRRLESEGMLLSGKEKK